MRRSGRRSGCPVNFSLELFGDAWSLLVVRDLMFTTRTFYTEFLNAGEGIATNVLADRLKRLEEGGIISREGTGRRARYGLTEKGLELLPMMLEMIDWGTKHDPHTQADLLFVARLRKDRAGVAKDLGRRLSIKYRLRRRTGHANAPAPEPR